MNLSLIWYLTTDFWKLSVVFSQNFVTTNVLITRGYFKNTTTDFIWNFEVSLKEWRLDKRIARYFCIFAKLEDSRICEMCK